MPTKGQQQEFEKVHKRLGRAPSTTQQRRFDKASSTAAYKMIERLHVEVEVFALFNFSPEPGMATPKQLRRYAEKRREAGEPITLDDARWAKSLSSIELNQETVDVMRGHQVKLDARGVTPSGWRLEHGFYDPELLHTGQREAAERRQQREQEAAVQRRVRNVGKPTQPEKVPDYVRATKGA